MIRIELIVCYDNYRWEDCKFADIPENLQNNQDAAIEWLAKKNRLDFGKNVSYIGVYNWVVDESL